MHVYLDICTEDVVDVGRCCYTCLVNLLIVNKIGCPLENRRYCMWMLGNANTLCTDDVWKALIQDTEARGCFLQTDDRMLKVITRIKNDIDELADLFHSSSGLFHDALWKVKVYRSLHVRNRSFKVSCL